MIIRLTTLLLALFIAMPAHAQESIPEVPAPIQNLVNDGAQIRFLGKDYGVESWLTIKNGQEQYFYVLPGGEAFLMGVMFDKTGKLVTLDQVQRLRGDGSDTLLDTLTNSGAETAAAQTNTDLKSPSEQMYSDIQNANWIALGNPSAPIAYSFIDPRCPHCHNFIEDVRPDIEAGRLQLRLVPVGFKDETRAQAAFLIAAPNPQERWFKHMDGDKTALPAKAEINQQGVQRNLAIMQSWEFTATPMVVYRGKDGTVKIIRGRPKNPKTMITDLGAQG